MPWSAMEKHRLGVILEDFVEDAPYGRYARFDGVAEMGECIRAVLADVDVPRETVEGLCRAASDAINGKVLEGSALESMVATVFG